jgi:hypothetical protein
MVSRLLLQFQQLPLRLVTKPKIQLQRFFARLPPTTVRIIFNHNFDGNPNSVTWPQNRPGPRAEGSGAAAGDVIGGFMKGLVVVAPVLAIFYAKRTMIGVPSWPMLPPPEKSPQKR